VDAVFLYSASSDYVYEVAGWKTTGLGSIPGGGRFFLLSEMFKWVMYSTTDLHPGLKLRKSGIVLLLSVSHGVELFGN
jgi:hypothetical protein